MNWISGIGHGIFIPWPVSEKAQQRDEKNHTDDNICEGEFHKPIKISSKAMFSISVG
jgi:hypothetical protein